MSEEKQVTTKDMQDEIYKRALSVPDQAHAIAVTNDGTYSRAGEVLTTVKALRKEINETFDPIIKKAHAAHKEAVTAKKRVDAPLQDAENFLKPQMAEYIEKKERERREEEDRKRREAEKREEEARLAEAAALEAEGRKEEAEEVLETPTFVPAPKVNSTLPKVAGISGRKTWDFEIVDLTKIPRAFLIVNETGIRKVVTALKEKTDIPGIRVFERTGISAGSR